MARGAQRAKWRDAYSKLDKLWACAKKAARDYGVEEADAPWFVITYLIDEKEECQNPDTLNGIIDAAYSRLKKLHQDPDTKKETA
jgi:hypothetical protein